MPMTTYLRRAGLNHLFRTATLAKATFVYAGLFLNDPTAAGSGTEVSTIGTGYAREPIAVADASWSAPADLGGPKAVHNLLPVEYDAPAGLWGTPSHWGLFDQVSGGNLWYYGEIMGGLRLVDVGTDPVSFAVSALNVTLGQAASDYLETKWLNHTLRTDTLTKLANIYLALHSVDPTDVGNIGELTGAAYARVPVAVANASWSAPVTVGDSEMISNLGVLQFPTPGANWGTYNYMSGNDAATLGNALFAEANEVGRIVNAFDNPPTWLPGNLQIFMS
jgi:hypothetical protein